MNKQAFLHLRSQMLNHAVQDCFDILSPHFPYVTNEYPVVVNLKSGYRHGGTGIVNYNMSPEEAHSVVDTFKEIDCGCLFVCPVPVSGLFTEDYLGVGTGSASFADRVLSQVRAGFLGERVKFPPYFSVHMIGAPVKAACRAQLKELLIQNLLVRKPSAATAVASDSVVFNLLKKHTLCGDSNDSND